MRALLLLVLLGAAATSQAQPPTVLQLLEQKVLERVKKIEEGNPGVLGVSAIDLTTGRTIAHHGDVVFPQASVIKIPIMIRVYQLIAAGRLSLERKMKLSPEEAAGTEGVFAQKLLSGGPLETTLGDLLREMIVTSDNTATNKLIHLVTMDSVNQALQEMGLRYTRLQRRMLDWEAALRNEENLSTPLEMARLVERIYRKRMVDEASSEQMLELMKQVNADFRKTVPAGVVVASKPGEVGGVWCETGIVFLEKRPFVLSVMSTFQRPDSNPVPAVVKIFYEHFATLAGSNQYGHKVQ